MTWQCQWAIWCILNQHEWLVTAVLTSTGYMYIMYLRRMTSWLGSVDIAMTCDWAGDYAVSTSSEHLSLSLHIHTHTHLGRMTCDCAVSTVSAHVPEKNDLWLCSINKQWVYMYLRRMTCDCAVSTSSEYTCTWEEWLVTVQYQQSVSAQGPKKNDLWQCSINNQWVHLYLRRMTCDWAVSAWWDTAPLTKLHKKGDWQPAWSSVCGGLERRSHGLMHTRWGPIRVCTWMKTMQNNTQSSTSVS